jgi:hypothetical protein
MAVLTPQPKMQFTTAAGVPLSGGKVYTYIAGTTTPQATFTDYTGATPNPNPVILDSRGEANIWLGGALYKFKLTDANDVEIWTVDYISAPTSSVSAVLSGNVTIDSDTPGPALKITQTGTGPVLRVQDSADPDATPFIIDNAGNVGIGTPTPSAQLEATGTARLGSLTLTSTPLPVASGGTGAVDPATARANLGTAASGAVTGSGLTMATARLLGRTTAGTGAVQEITAGVGLSLSAGNLAAAPGTIVDRAYTETTTYTTVTASIPLDDTIPQNTEGTQILSASITPKTVTNRVRARVVVRGLIQDSANRQGAVCLFRGAGADAIAATSANLYSAGAQIAQTVVLEFEDSPASTSAQTYNVRVGPSGGGTMYVNGNSSGRIFGGSMRATLVLEEITA